MKDYKKMSSSLRRFPEYKGLVITEDLKHYKLTYYGDPRYWTTIAKIGSHYQGCSTHNYPRDAVTQQAI